jgi:hypothetical protein
MPANNSISLVSLDFDTIKSNLITYLQNNPAFADFNFEGSNINVLLDILSYNTFLNSFYLNMAVSEMFIDSAQNRDSVVSIAKALNYTPRTYTSSLAILDCHFPQSGLSTFTIPQGTKFSGKNSNNTFTFVTRDSVTVYPSGGYFTVANLNVYEGKYVSDVYVVDNTIQNQRFILSNDNLDGNSLAVTVVENNGANTTLFTQSTSLFGLTNTSPVYFLQGAENGQYELKFGDGVFGRAPLNGATILANYMITSGSDANMANNFQLDDNLGTYNGYGSFILPTITVSNSSFNGANSESIESIRFNAPISFQTQERAVTVNDYKQLILQQYTDIKNVHVYGGETVNTSVQFGKTFITYATYSGYNISDSEKIDIENFLLQRNILGITPVIVDPTYLYLDVYTTVKYDPNQTVLSAIGIQNLVANTIIQYNTNNLQDFNTEFRLSDFMTAISNTDVSISSNETKVVMKKIQTPQLNSPISLNISFNNAIEPGSFLSTTFLSNGVTYQYTDYNPNVNSFNISQSSSGIVINNTSNIIYLQSIVSSGNSVYTNVGNIDYNNGVINIGQIVVNDFLGNEGIVFYASPLEENVTSFNTDIIEIDSVGGINITVTTV